MKISIHSDEAYPVYGYTKLLTWEEVQRRPNSNIEVSDEQILKWERVQEEYQQMQNELKELDLKIQIEWFDQLSDEDILKYYRVDYKDNREGVGVVIYAGTYDKVCGFGKTKEKALERALEAFRIKMRPGAE